MGAWDLLVFILQENLHAHKIPSLAYTGGRAKQAPFVKLAFYPRNSAFLDPKRLFWPTFDIYHVKRILLSKYYKMQHLEAFWPVSLKDFLFSPKGGSI